MPKQRVAKQRGPGRPAGTHSGEGRDAILAATRELLAERGLPRVTLREVAERADVQPALVNYYFGSKRGLLREVVRGVAARVRERIAAEGLRPGDPEERMRHMLRAVASAFAEQPYAPRLLFEQVLFADDESLDEFAKAYALPNLAVITQLLQDGRREGVLREVDVSFLAPQVIGMLFFFFLSAPLQSRLFEHSEIDAERAARYADSAADLVLHGLALREPVRP
jgi:AcrR family transcriptional regulator